MVKQYTSSNDVDDDDLDNDAKHNRLVQIKVDRGKREASDHFSILGIYTNIYNKWYISSVIPKCNNYIDEGKYRVYARMVTLNCGFGT